MLVRLKKILETYTDTELEEMELWINSDDEISQIHIEEYAINLITNDTEIKINGVISKEGSD